MTAEGVAPELSPSKAPGKRDHQCRIFDAERRHGLSIQARPRPSLGRVPGKDAEAWRVDEDTGLIRLIYVSSGMNPPCELSISATFEPIAWILQPAGGVTLDAHPWCLETTLPEGAAVDRIDLSHGETGALFSEEALTEGHGCIRVPFTHKGTT